MNIGYSPRLPLRSTRYKGILLNETLPEVVKQNLKNLLLTNPRRKNNGY